MHEVQSLYGSPGLGAVARQSVKGAVGDRTIGVDYDDDLWRIGSQMVHAEVERKAFPAAGRVRALDDLGAGSGGDGGRLVAAVIGNDQQAIRGR
jgi:hypothetical protein